MSVSEATDNTGRVSGSPLRGPHGRELEAVVLWVQGGREVHMHLESKGYFKIYPSLCSAPIDSYSTFLIIFQLTLSQVIFTFVFWKGRYSPKGGGMERSNPILDVFEKHEFFFQY